MLYASGYTDDELDEWTDRIATWSARGLEVYVYFDNDAKAYAPLDATRLRERCAARGLLLPCDHLAPGAPAAPARG